MTVKLVGCYLPPPGMRTNVCADMGKIYHDEDADVKKWLVLCNGSQKKLSADACSADSFIE